MPKMQRRTLALILVLLAIASAVGACVVYAGFVKSIPYTEFNKLSPITFYQLDKNYTSWEATVINNLVYNSSTSGYALVRFQTSTAAGSPYIELSFLKDGTLLVFYSYDGSSNVQAASGQWTAGKPIYVSLSSDGYLDVGDSSGKEKILKDFTYGNLTLQYVGAHGDQYTATGGYMQVELGGLVSDVSTTVYQWIPVIVTFAMLGFVLSLIKKYT
jgi:hypothetical protein